MQVIIWYLCTKS